MKKNMLLHAVSLATSSPFIALSILTYFAILHKITYVEVVHSLLFLVIIPLIIPYYWSLKKNIEWDYPRRRERIIPLFSVTASYVVSFISLSLFSRNFLALCLHLSYAITSLITLIITLYYKISIHIMGIIGPATFLLWLKHVFFSITLFTLSIIVAYTRIKLKRHTCSQVILAYMVAFLINTIVFHIYKALY